MLIILDGILDSPEEHSFLRGVQGFERLAENSKVCGLVTPECETPEALLLGLSPDEGQLRQGPLTVSALGWDPPERSVHFHLSLLSLGDSVSEPKQTLNDEEFNVVKGVLERLNTKKLTTLLGQGLDHGLVWERLAEMVTMSPPEVSTLHESLPKGDGEDELRRLIDDSVNLLHEEEFNLRRIDNGHDPVNLAWPWGHGVRLPVPNLALRYGYPYRYESNSFRLAGLVRLAGFRHGALGRLGAGLQTDFGAIPYDHGTVVYLDPWSRFRQGEYWDEVEYMAKRCGQLLIERLLDHVAEHKRELNIVLLGKHGGLAASFSSNEAQGHFPLNERSMEEAKLPRVQLHEFVRTALG